MAIELDILNTKIVIGLVMLSVEICLVIFLNVVPDGPTNSTIVEELNEMATTTEEPNLEGPCEQGVNCHLPKCYCSTFAHQMKTRDIPQMVYFGVDDGVTPDAVSHYNRLFRRDRKNPNGCPISATLFITDVYTDYGLLRNLYNRGFEIAVHSVTHGKLTTGEQVLEEAAQEQKNILSLAGIPRDDIVGWRSPHLLTAGDDQDNVLKKLGFEYDISLTYTRHHMNDSEPWPFTLDYSWPFVCHIPPCPKMTHRGIWEVPVNSMRDYKDEHACVYVDGCLNRPHNVEEAYQYIMDNFRDNYYGNKAPFGFNMHYAWLLRPSNFEAMDRAIRAMLSHKDVFIVTVKQMIDWMKQPTNLTNIDNFKPWNC